MTETNCKAKITGNLSVSIHSGVAYGVHRKAPGVTFRTDHMTDEQIAALSGECITIKEGQA